MKDTTLDARRALATDAEFCEFAGLTKGQSAQLRYLGSGPKFVKVTGRQVRYRWSDIEDWIDSRTQTRTDDRPGAA
ncbi:DNA-binding protein [Rhodococcus opacus]|nr:DNA-binding protein [Rhodococcus opacus]